MLEFLNDTLELSLRYSLQVQFSRIDGDGTMLVIFLKTI